MTTPCYEIENIGIYDSYHRHVNVSKAVYPSIMNSVVETYNNLKNFQVVGIRLEGSDGSLVEIDCRKFLHDITLLTDIIEHHTSFSGFEVTHGSRLFTSDFDYDMERTKQRLIRDVTIPLLMIDEKSLDILRHITFRIRDDKVKAESDKMNM